MTIKPARPNLIGFQDNTRHIFYVVIFFVLSCLKLKHQEDHAIKLKS